MVNKLINIGNIFFLGIAIIIAIILPYQLIYLSKTLAVCMLVISLLILTILTVKNSIKVQIRLSSLSVILLLILILDICLFYRLNKFLAICILVLVILALIMAIITLKTTNSIKVQIRLSLLSIILFLILVFDNGWFYRVNANIVYQDEDVFIVDKNEPTAIMACGTVFTLFVRKYWGFQGYEIIPNKYCFTELPEIELNNEKKIYTFQLKPNGYVYGTIEFHLESKEIISNIKGVRNLD